MAQARTRLTSAEFRAFCELPQNAHRRFELHEGEIVEVPSPSPLHQWIVAELLYFLKVFLRMHPLGYVFGDNLDYEPVDGVIVQPDLSFVSFERAPSLPERFRLMPDLAVEVTSPSNTERDMLRKVLLYFAYGAREVWVVYPEERMVRVYTPAAQGAYVRQFAEGEQLTESAVLPNFALNVADLFPKAQQARE
ncbi:MAG: Uma2 family endonuclease [Anaerolineae bacterium]|nr:Uma2 family endonuclease [Anaerolineae bacterium]